MQIILNGTHHEVLEPSSLASLMATLGVPENGIAVALNGAVITRSAWASTPLPANAQVDLVTAMQGG